MARAQGSGSGQSAAGIGSLVSPGPWSINSLTVLPPDKPGRNPPISSEEQEEGLQACVCSSLCIVLQQQPGQTGQFPAVRASGSGWAAAAGLSAEPRAWHGATRNHRCAGAVCKALMLRCGRDELPWGESWPCSKLAGDQASA